VWNDSFVHIDYSRGEHWKKITCNAPPYVPYFAKTTFICNHVLRYLQRLTENIIFPSFDSQGVPRKKQLFILEAALHGIRVNTAFHIATQLDKQAQNSKAVIATGGIVTTLARGLGL